MEPTRHGGGFSRSQNEVKLRNQGGSMEEEGRHERMAKHFQSPREIQRCQKKYSKEKDFLKDKRGGAFSIDLKIITWQGSGGTCL